ncbi:hypothetical protein FO519_000724 [Halicephalobus sp. NKZ332]|nr:hypothetical protein FO519_000724 [Halicephalobus sp. NKZ332]
MSASIDSNGCLSWQGKVIVSNKELQLDKLRVGRISFSPQANVFMIYTGNGRNEKPETSFRVTEVLNVSLYGLKDTVCTFKLTHRNKNEKGFNVAIDFKGVRDPGNQLTPNEKAKSFCEFLLKLTNGARSATVFPVVTGSGIKKQSVVLLKKQNKNGKTEKTIINLQLPLEKDGIDSLISNKRTKIQNSSATTAELPGSSRRPARRGLDDTIADVKPSKIPKFSDDVPQYTSIYESLRSRNRHSSAKKSVTAYAHRSSPSGLANMGNTCYMNSVLQATFIIDSLSKRLFESLKFFQKEALNPDVFIERYLPLMKALSNLLSNRCCGNNLTVFLKSVLGCVSTAADKFRNNRQEDAHEFLMDMLSQLQSEFNEAVKQLNGRRPYLLQSTDPIRECFGYTIRRTFTCEKCSFESTVEEENTNFIVHISDERLKSRGFTFADILRDSMAVEAVDHQCDKCGDTRALMKPEFVRLPEHFIFVVRRYLYNQQNGNKHKLHAKIIMHKYLTFVTTAEVPQTISIEEQIKLATSETANEESDQKKRKKNNKPPSRWIDNRWRDRKINTAKIGYMIEDMDEEAVLKGTFAELCRRCNNSFSVKEKVIPSKQFKEDVSEIFIPLVYVLTGGSESLYVKLKDMMWNVLLKNADLYCELLNKSEKAFRDYITKARKSDISPTNLEFHAFAAVFQTVLVLFEDGKWVSYSPKFILQNGERQLVNAKHPVLKKKLYLPKNVSYLASSLHPRRRHSYCLTSAVCHVGMSTEVGHYKCAVQTAAGTWSMCNDDVITNCQEKTVLDKSGDSGYILFYTACKDRSPSPKRERIEDVRRH